MLGKRHLISLRLCDGNAYTESAVQVHALLENISDAPVPVSKVVFSAVNGDMENGQIAVGKHRGSGFTLMPGEVKRFVLLDINGGTILPNLRYGSGGFDVSEHLAAFTVRAIAGNYPIAEMVCRAYLGGDMLCKVEEVGGKVHGSLWGVTRTTLQSRDRAIALA